MVSELMVVEYVARIFQTEEMVDRLTAALRTGSESGISFQISTSTHSLNWLDFFTASITAITYWQSSKVAADATASLTQPLRSSTRENASLNADTYNG